MANDYGLRLLPNILHYEASINPGRTFAMVAKSDDVKDGFDRVTFYQVACAVNHVARWLQNHFEDGEKPPKHETLVYIGIPDLRYNIIFYAAAQCRYQTFFPSPRNPSAVNRSLLEQSNCSRLVFTAEVASAVRVLERQATKLQLSCEQLPSLQNLLAVPENTYQYDLNYAAAMNDPVLILHSSGSTGLPKLVTSTHGTLATFDVRHWPTVPGRRNHDSLSTLRFAQPDSRIYDVFPPFHLAGFIMKVMVPLFNFTIPIFGPPIRPPSGALAVQVIRSQNPRGVVLPPSIIEQMYHEPGGSEVFDQLDVLLFAGGPLPSAIGSAISTQTALCQFYGSTEIGQIRQLTPSPDDWAYIEFHPHESLELQPSGEANLHELVLFSGTHLERTSSFYHNYPNIKEWRTRDLFEPHPTKHNLWKFYARTDDILVFSSGEKLNPIPMESALTTLPAVSGALMVGQGRSQSALLIELAPDVRFSERVEELWTSVDAANKLLPSHGRVTRAMVIVTNADRPFIRAGKGTVIRRLTEELYKNEIQALYQPKLSPDLFTLRPSAFNSTDINTLWRSLLSQQIADSQLGDDDNIFANGVDSIMTAEVVRQLKTVLLQHRSESELSWISTETIYLNPNLRQLTEVLSDYLMFNKIPGKRDRIEAMKLKIKQYCGLILKSQSGRAKSGTRTLTRYSVAITGTTGYFGGVLLTNLIDNPNVRRIYCLNRSRHAQEKYVGSGQTHGEAVQFLHVNFELPNLGLAKHTLTHLLEDCDFLIHNAWRVDYNLTLDSYEDNLQGLVNLVNLASHSSRHLRFVFISSIAATGVWTRRGSVQKTIPEEVVGENQLAMTLDIGYAESKRVAEHILADASSKVHVPVTVVRMGQLVPSSNCPKWPENDILTVFLRTSKVSGHLASDFLDIANWVPVNKAANIVRDIIHVNSLEDGPSSNFRVFNVVDPHGRPWVEFLDVIQDWCGPNVRRVTLQQWVEHLQSVNADDTELLTTMPALRMLRMFSLMAERGPTHEYVTEASACASSSMGELGMTSGDTMALWLRHL